MIGKFKQLITFKNPTKVSDGAGGHTETYAAYASNIWANVEDEGGARDFSQGQDTIINKKKMSILYNQDVVDDLTKDTRIEYNGQEYAIERWFYVGEEKKVLRFKTVGVI
jgi:SPP1 family predicted phage head-tail adaptor